MSTFASQDIVADLILVRHGRAADTEGRCIGHTDVELSPDGLEAVTRLARDWHRHTVDGLMRSPSRIESSDLRRAADTARAIAEPWHLPVQLDARLREMEFGEWDGVSWTDIEARDGARLQEWMAMWTTTRAPGGESLDDLLARADDWLRDFQASLISQAPSGPVVVVAHAGWIRALLTVVMHRPTSSFFELPVDYAHGTVLRIHNGVPEVVASNVQSFA